MVVSRPLLLMSVVYLVTALYGFNFIFSAVKYGLFSADFMLIILLVLLPLLFYALYFLRGRIEMLYGREVLLARLIVLFTIIAAVFVLFFIVPLSY